MDYEDPKVNMALDDIIKLSKPAFQAARYGNPERFKFGGAKRFSFISEVNFKSLSEVRTQLRVFFSFFAVGNFTFAKVAFTRSGVYP